MNKKELTEEQKQALERFKRTKDDTSTLAGFFYSILGDASPAFKEQMENQAATLLDAGSRIGQELVNAEKDPKKLAEMQRQMQQLATKIRSSVRPPPKKEDEEEK